MGERVGLPLPVGEWPLFPGRSANVPTKAGAVATIREAARRLGLQLQEHNGTGRFSGHSLRATVAEYLAAAGVDLWRIQVLGRWGSDAIRKYITEAKVSAVETIAAEAVA